MLKEIALAAVIAFSMSAIIHEIPKSKGWWPEEHPVISYAALNSRARIWYLDEQQLKLVGKHPKIVTSDTAEGCAITLLLLFIIGLIYMRPSFAHLFG